MHKGKATFGHYLQRIRGERLEGEKNKHAHIIARRKTMKEKDQFKLQRPFDAAFTREFTSNKNIHCKTPEKHHDSGWHASTHARTLLKKSPRNQPVKATSLSDPGQALVSQRLHQQTQYFYIFAHSRGVRSPCLVFLPYTRRI